MKQIKWVFILLLATSCQFFETEKISSETFYEEKIESIDWEYVDQYPTFSQCEEFIEKEDRKRCFETELSSYVSQSVGNRNIVTHMDLNSTVLMDLTISKTGKITDLEIEMDSLLQQSVPLLKEWLTESIDALPPMEPAYKRGIPVETRFTLPVVIATN